MASKLLSEPGEDPPYTSLLAPEFLDEGESASICPLLTPSPSRLNMLCVSPDGIQDPESASTCPLLEQSPPVELNMPTLDPLSGIKFDQISADTELPAYVGLNEGRDSRSSSLPVSSEGAFPLKRGSVINNLMESSSSSSSSALQDNPACVQLLNHHYQHLGQEKKENFQQENGTATCLELSGHKLSGDDFLLHWNWPIIRTSCFWAVLSLTVACLCIVIGMIATVPRKCLPAHKWHQGGVFYEIFPASFQDSGHDGLGDLRGVTSRTEYFKSLGISAIRLNSIFEAWEYPEAFQDVKNLTTIDPHLGNISDMKNMLAALHSNNISVIIDLPIYPLVRSLKEFKSNLKKPETPILRDNIADKISNTVHNHRSHRDLNESEGTPARLLSEVKSDNKLMLTPYIDGGISGLMKATSEHLKATSKTIIEEALHYWFNVGVDGIYIKGLENYVYDPHLLPELKSWKKVKNNFSGEKNKILMADYRFFEAAEVEQKEDILETFDLFDIYLEVGNGSEFMADEIDRMLKSEVFKAVNYPWLHWNIGNMETRRLAQRVGNNIGAILFQSILPGTISIFYGDEVSLMESQDPHGDRRDLKHHSQLSPMIWINDNTRFTPETIIPWLPYGTADHDSTTQIIRNLTEIRKSNPSIYMNKVVKEKEIIRNTAVRYFDESVVVVERTYPRRNTFVGFFNADVNALRRDMSHIYYSGEQIQDSEGNAGQFVTFKDYVLNAGESAIVKLDK